MIMTRSHAITAGVAAAAALAATGITYASAASEPQAAPAVVQQAPMGGDSNNNGGKGNEGNNEHGNEHGNNNEHGRKHHEDRGWIQINERSYSAHSSGCVVVVSGLGSTSLNIRNDSRKTVEVFRGLTCDNGAPIATVGPHSTSNGVFPRRTRGVFVKNGVVGSFRVIDRHHDRDDDRGDDRGDD